MARIRSIKPEFFTSLDIACLTIPARLLFIGLWTYVDDQGRGLDEVRLIKAAIFPLDDALTTKAIEKLMVELATCGRIHRYQDDGQNVFQIDNWTHQKIDRPRDSKYRSFVEPSTNGHRKEHEHS